MNKLLHNACVIMGCFMVIEAGLIALFKLPLTSEAYQAITVLLLAGIFLLILSDK